MILADFVDNLSERIIDAELITRADSTNSKRHYDKTSPMSRGVVDRHA